MPDYLAKFNDERLRQLTIDGHTYYSARDWLRILGYSTTSIPRILERHCPNKRIGHYPSKYGKRVKLIVIPLGDLLYLTMRCKLRTASEVRQLMLSQLQHHPDGVTQEVSA